MTITRSQSAARAGLSNFSIPPARGRYTPRTIAAHATETRTISTSGSDSVNSRILVASLPESASNSGRLIIDIPLVYRFSLSHARVSIREAIERQSSADSGTKSPCRHSMTTTATARTVTILPASPTLLPAISAPKCRVVSRRRTKSSVTAVKPPK